MTVSMQVNTVISLELPEINMGRVKFLWHNRGKPLQILLAVSTGS